MAQTDAAEDANGGDAFNAVTIITSDVTVMHKHCTVHAAAADTKTYNPADSTVVELEAAARGRSHEMAGTLAVALLRAELGDEARRRCAGCRSRRRRRALPTHGGVGAGRLPRLPRLPGDAGAVGALGSGQAPLTSPASPA